MWQFILYTLKKTSLCDTAFSERSTKKTGTGAFDPQQMQQKKVNLSKKTIDVKHRKQKVAEFF